MGWPWSVYLAQITLEDVLLGSAPWLTREAQLALGRPAPGLAPGGALHWEYIDDFGYMVLERLDGTDVGMDQARAREHFAGTLAEAGLPVHKEETGSTF
eukprot:14269112-Alexandrium_andersonii.AAC.1